MRRAPRSIILLAPYLFTHVPNSGPIRPTRPIMDMLSDIWALFYPNSSISGVKKAPKL